MKYYREFPLAIQDNDTDEAIHTLCWFYFYEGYKGTRLNPPEAPSVSIGDIKVCGVSIMDGLSSSQLDRVESDLLEAILGGEY